eukprot:46988-Eustigmatos_ZCMA.PRE.1
MTVTSCVRSDGDSIYLTSRAPPEVAGHLEAAGDVRVEVLGMSASNITFTHPVVSGGTVCVCTSGALLLHRNATIAGNRV